MATSVRGVVLSLVLAASPAAAEPAMWTVRDADTTVHLFGTVHLLPPGTDWRTPALEGALAAADTLWLEIDILSDTSGAWAMIAEGTSPDLTLRQRLSAEDHAAVEAAAAKVGLPMSTIEPLRPWLAALTITLEGIKRAGYDAEGVDLHLARRAASLGVPVRGFETGRDQVAFLSGLSPEVETAMLMQTARSLEEGLELFPRMFAAWQSGDREALEAVLVTSLGDAAPDLVDRLLGDRNRRWAERFDEIMAEPGSRVVAVGAAHLVGDDALPDLLGERGYTVKRVMGAD